jgi:hypothetical protein
LKSLLQTALAPWESLSVELIFFSLLLLLSKAAASTQTLLSQSVIMITRYKSGAILSFFKIDNFFSKNATFKLLAMANDESKNFIHF